MNGVPQASVLDSQLRGVALLMVILEVLRAPGII